MTKPTHIAISTAVLTLALSACTSNGTSGGGNDNPQATVDRISELRSRLGGDESDASAVSDLVQLAASAEEAVQQTTGRNTVQFAWTVAAAYANESITLSRSADAETFDKAYASAIVYADSASEVCLNRFESIDPSQGNLCGVALAARSLNDSRKTVRDFSSAVNAGDWAATATHANTFSQQIEVSWPTYSTAIAQLPNNDQDQTPFKQAALNEACGMDRAQAATAFLPTLAAADSPHLSAKQAYWTAMSGAADFLGITSGAPVCTAEPDGMNCRREKSIALSEACD